MIRHLPMIGLLLSALISGCTTGSETSETPTPEVGGAAGRPVATKRLRVGMMPKLVGIDYFNECRKGAEVLPPSRCSRVDPLSSWYFMQNKMPQNVWYQFHFGN